MRKSPRSKARNPEEAVKLYEHKLAKRWPFLEARGYDLDHATDYRVFGKTVRDDKRPTVQGMIQSDNYFFYHSQNHHGYIFVHALTTGERINIRGLMFETFAEAYNYAHRYGCTIGKKPLEVDIRDFMCLYDSDDIDMFVDKIDITYGMEHRDNMRDPFANRQHLRRRNE